MIIQFWSWRNLEKRRIILKQLLSVRPFQMQTIWASARWARSVLGLKIGNLGVSLQHGHLWWDWANVGFGTPKKKQHQLFTNVCSVGKRWTTQNFFEKTSSMTLLKCSKLLWHMRTPWLTRSTRLCCCSRRRQGVEGWILLKVRWTQKKSAKEQMMLLPPV